MDLLHLGFNHFDDADVPSSLFASSTSEGAAAAVASAHNSPRGVAVAVPASAAASAAAAAHAHAHAHAAYVHPRSPESDDLMSSAGSIGSSSRCASPAPFDEPLGSDFMVGRPRMNLSIRVPSAADDVLFAPPVPLMAVSAAEPAALAAVARRVNSVRPGVRVHRASVAEPAEVVPAQAVDEPVLSASVVDAEFAGAAARAVPARVVSSELAESVSSDESGFLAASSFSRPRLASVSTSSMPGSPVSFGRAVPAFAATAAAAAGGASVLGKRRSADGESQDPSAKRARRLYSSPPAAPMAPCFLMYRSAAPTHDVAAPRTFVVTDAEDRIFTVTVGVEPSCTCSGFAAGRLCDHLSFVFTSVLKAPLDSPVMLRARLALHELAALYAAAPRDPAAQVQPLSKRRSSLVVRQGTDGRECTLCCQPFRAGQLSYCMGGCGSNFHESCMERWQAYCARATTVVPAKVMSAAPKTARKVMPASVAGGADAADQARAAQPLDEEPLPCPVCRCNWKEEDDHLGGMKAPSAGSIADDMDSLGYASPLGGAQTFFDSLDFCADGVELVL